MGWAIAIGLAVAAALYIWKSGDKPAKAVRSVFVRGEPGRSEQD